MFRKTWIALGAAALGAVATLTIDPATAWAKPPAGESFQLKYGRKLIKDNNPARKTNPRSYIFVQVPGTQIAIYGSKSTVGRGGSTNYIVLGSLLGAPDVRTATLPIEYETSGGGLVFSFNEVISRVGKDIRIPTIRTTDNSWVADDSQPFRFVITKFSPETSRIQGTFSGTLIPGDSNDAKHQKNIKITGGKFNAVISFTN